MKNNGPTPTNAIKIPPNAGTINLMMLKAIEFRANAFTSRSFGIIEARREMRQGSFIVQEIPIKKTKVNKFQMFSWPISTIIPKEKERIA